MSWEKTLDSYGAVIEERLKKFLDEAVKDAGDYHPFIGKVYSDIEEFDLWSFVEADSNQIDL